MAILLLAVCTENRKTEIATSKATDNAGATVYKYTTEIPPGITIPDKVETRLGTLTFKDGFPDDSTVQI